MRRVRGVLAAAAASLCVWGTLAWGSEPAAQADLPRFLLFSNGDIWNHGGFLHGGMVWSPAGVDRNGFALKAMFGGGTYRYLSGALGNTEVTGRMLTAAILPGWRFVRGKFIASIFAGLDLQDHRLSPDDPSAGLRGSHAGFRVNAELWYEPTPLTMAAADGSVSTIDASYNARLAFGWKIFDRYYVGPEVQGFAAGDNYRQLRAGLHVTGLRTASVEWSGGLGWAQDSDDRDGPYARIGLLMRR
jgi:hypothetical protein